jgi:hypothetical protein
MNMNQRFTNSFAQTATSQNGSALKHSFFAKTAWMLVFALVLNGFAFTGNAKAAMVGSSSVVASEQSESPFTQVDKSSLLTSMQSDELREQLVAYGVDPEMAEQRVANLTVAEIDELNQTLAAQPAGAGLAGAAVTIVVVLVITDMLCATDVFTFVRCINR